MKRTNRGSRAETGRPDEGGSAEPAARRPARPPQPRRPIRRRSTRAGERTGGNPSWPTSPADREDSTGDQPDHQPGPPRSRTTRTRSRRAIADRLCSKTSTSARRSRISTTSASRSGSCTPEAPAATAISRSTRAWLRYTKARFLQDPAVRTPVFVRFSTVAGSRGSTDLARDVRGFAVKFYTRGRQLRPRREQHPRLLHPGRDQVPRPDPRGQARARPRDAAGRVGPRHVLGLHLADAGIDAHDHVGHVRPRDPAQLPHDGGLRRPHLPPGQRSRGNPGFVKFHWKPLLGVHSVAWDEAQKISGKDPDFLRRDLWEAIESGNSAGVGARPADRRGRTGARLRLRPPGPDQDHSRGAGAGAAGRPADPQSQPGQLLRRDGAGGVPSGARRAGHRLQQRSPAAGPALLLHRHPAASAWAGPTSTRSPSTGRSRPCTTTSATGSCARRSTASKTAYEPNSIGGGCPMQIAIGGGRLRQLPGARRRAEGARALGEVLRPLQPGGAVLPKPVRPGEGPHRGGAAVRAGQGGAPAIRERMVGMLGARRRAPWPRGSRRGSGFPRSPKIELPLNRSIGADGDPQDREPTAAEEAVASARPR